MGPYIKSTILLALLLTQVSTLAHAQKTATLSGYIRDRASGEDLIGATVYAKNVQQGTTTNVYGFYSLSLAAGTHTLVFSFIGFESYEVELELQADQTLDIELAEQALELETVEVVGERENANVSNVEMSIVKLEAAKVKQVPAVLGEADVVKTFLLLPGVSNAAEGSTSFNIRGGGADQNLVMLDEGVLYNTSHLFGLFSVFNADAVKDIKLYKGGIPSLYGGRLSSVLDVRQKEGNNKKYAANFGIGLISGRALVEGPIVKNKGSFMIAGRRSYGDAFLALVDNDQTAYFYDLNLKANYTLSSRDRIYLSGYLGRDKFAIDDIFLNNWGNVSATLRWNRVISNKLFANVSLINSIYDFELGLLPPGAEYNRTSEIGTLNLKTDFGWFINNQFSLDFGASQTWYDFTPGNIRPLNGSSVQALDLDEKFANETTVYAGANQTIGRLTLQYGARYTYFARKGDQTIRQYANDAPVLYNEVLQRYSEGEVVGERAYDTGDNIATFGNLEPRVSAAYMFNTRQSLKASYNRTHQYLHLVTNTNTPTPIDIWTPSGPFLKPQQADQYALGYFQNFEDNTYEASVETYYKDMNNLPEFIDGAELVTNNFLETELLSGKGRAYGAEFLVRKNKGRFTGWLGYTLSRTERRILGVDADDPGINNGEWYPANVDKTHDFSLTGSYKVNDRWTLSANFVYATGAPVNYPRNRYNYGGLVVPHYEGRNGNRLPAYHRLDLAATLKGKPKGGKPSRGEWSFSLYNVYNRKNASAINFGQNEDTRIPEAVRVSLLGIIPSVSYSFSL